MFDRRLVLAGLMLACGPLYAATYTLEPDYTQAVVRWNHLGSSNPAAQFAQGNGTLKFDPHDLAHSGVEVTMPIASLATGVPGLDEHLRSADFFDLEKFPTATFRSVRVQQGATADRLKVSGNLEVHGVSRPVTLEVVLVKIGTNPRTQLPTVGFEATATVKRSEFGLGRFVPQVSDEIDLHLTSQGVEAGAYAAYQKAQAAAEAAKHEKQ